jgi:hypothetical protein
MQPIRRTISLICALGLILASATWLIYPWIMNGGLVLGWRPGAAAFLLVVGLSGYGKISSRPIRGRRSSDFKEANESVIA